MADKKISALTGATTPLTGTEVLPIVQGGSTVKVAVSDLTAGRAVSASSVTVSGIATFGTGRQWFTSNDASYAFLSTVTGGSGNGIYADANNSALMVNGGGIAIATSTGLGITGTASATGQINTTVKGASFNAGVNTGVSSSSYTNYKGTNAASTATSWIVGINPYAADGSGEFVDLATGLGLHLARNTGNAAFDGNVTSTAGNFVQGTAAKGVNFTANTPAAGMTSQLLNAYEEGTWTPTFTSLTVIGTPTYTGRYTRVGNVVYFSVRIQSTTSTSSTVGVTIMQGFPFVIATGENTVLSAINLGTLATLPNGAVAKSGGSTTAYLPTWSATADVVLSGFYTV